MKKGKIKEVFLSGIFIVLGAFMSAFAMHVFILPAKFAPGGVSGLASIIQNISDFPASITLIILNAPLVVLAFIFLSKKFAFKTACAIALSSLFLQIFTWVNFFTFQESGAHILASLAGGIITGAGIGLLVRTGASSGGTDIISLLIQKKATSLSISWLIFFMNIFVIALGGTLYMTVGGMDVNTAISVVLYSFLMTFVNSKSMEVMLNGMTSAVKFEVITSKPDELGAAIMKFLNRGVTIINSKGAYTHNDNCVLICVVTKRQITPFRKLLKEVDPCAFAFAMDTREVLGTGFRKR